MNRALASAASYRLRLGLGDPASPTLKEHPCAREFIAAGIDDLAKYRIMRLLYEHPSLVGDAAYFATCLGYHSAECTAALIEELVGSGLIEKVSDPELCRQRYRLAHHEDAHICLIRLYGMPRSSPELEGALQILGCRSLLRAAKGIPRQRPA